MNAICLDMDEMVQEILKIPGKKQLILGPAYLPGFNNYDDVVAAQDQEMEFHIDEQGRFQKKLFMEKLEDIKQHKLVFSLFVLQPLPVSLKKKIISVPLMNFYHFLLVRGGWYALSPEEIKEAADSIFTDHKISAPENYLFQEIPRTKPYKYHGKREA